MPQQNNSSPAPAYFLRKKFHFFLTLAVIGTILLSQYNLNSYCILLLLACRLVDGHDPVRLVRTAFSNRYFLAFLAVVLVEASGLLHTRNLDVGWRNVESKCTLIAIPFVLCSGPFTDAAGRRRLMSAYCVMLAAICLFCLYKAFRNYHITRDST